MTNSKDYEKLIHDTEQSTAGYCTIAVQNYASIFRAFCAQDGVTRGEALELTKAIISSRETVMSAIVMQQQREQGGK